MNQTSPFSKVERRLAELKRVPERNPLQAASARARFLNEAAKYQQAVSPAKQVRQSGWMTPIRKEKFAMNVIVALILAVSLLLGGGVTVMAAQDDLPNEPLYPVKLWTENASLALAGEPQERTTLLMYMAHKRVQEMVAMTDLGLTPPDQVRARLEAHIEQALELASAMEEPLRDQTMQQLRDQLQEQERIMQQLQTHANAETEPLLTRTRQMLQIHLQQVNESLGEPQGPQYQEENQMRYGQDDESTPGPNQQGEPGYRQDEPNGQGQGPAEPGTGSGNGEGNSAPGGQNPDAPQGGNGGPGNESPGGQNQGGSQDGSGSGSGSGSGPGGGGGGGNK